MQDISRIQEKLLPYSIGVYFDSQTEETIRGLWKKLAAIGVDFLFLTKQRPHLTLGIYKGLDLEQTDQTLTEVSAKTAVIPISFQYVGVFPTTRSIFLGPVLNEPLTTLHETIYQALKPHADMPNFSYYLPDHWVPHCGIGVEVDEEIIPEVIRITNQTISFPLEARIEEIGISTNIQTLNFCCYPLVDE